MIFTQAKEDVGWKEDFQLGCNSYSKILNSFPYEKKVEKYYKVQYSNVMPIYFFFLQIY